MNLQEIIDYCKNHGIENLNNVNVEFNNSDGGFKSFLPVEENGLTLETKRNKTTLYIDSY